MTLREALRWILGHFHNKEAAQDSTHQGTYDADYDDRQSIAPIIKEKQSLKSLPHQGEPEKKNADATHQRGLVQWTRNLAYTTGALALATFIVACFAGWQAWEMRKGSVDTAKLAEASDSANQLNAVGLRPWVDFDQIEPGTGFTTKGNTVSIMIKYSLKNTGRLPAEMTNVHLEMQPIAYYGPQIDLIDGDLVTGYQVDTCKKSENNTGNTVFPGQSLVNPYIVTVDAPRQRFEDILNRGEQIYVVLITGCVGYRLAISGHYGHTGASIIIARGTNSSVLPLGLPLEGIIRSQEIIKMRLPLEFAD
jgi:hypothetical protein